MARTKKKRNVSMVVNLPNNHPENKMKSKKKAKFDSNLKEIMKEQGGFKYWKKAGSRILEENERKEISYRAKPLACIWCDEVFASAKPFSIHSQCSRACRPYFCQCCGSRFRMIKKLEEHSKGHSTFPKKTYVCRSCGSHFETSGMSRVLPGYENEQFQVPSETLMEVDDDRRAGRVFEVLDSEDEEEEGDWSTIICTYCIVKKRVPCPFCGLTFPDLSSMTAHCVVHKGYFLYEYACDACERVFVSLPALEQHLSWHEGRNVFLCTVCGEKFSCIDDRESHREDHVFCQNMGALMLKTTNQNYIAKKKYQTTSPSFTAFVYYCTECDYSCSTKALVKAHVDSVHPSTFSSETEETYTEIINEKEGEKKTNDSSNIDLKHNEMSLPFEYEMMELEPSVGEVALNISSDLPSNSDDIIDTKSTFESKPEGTIMVLNDNGVGTSSPNKTSTITGVLQEAFSEIQENKEESKGRLPCPFCERSFMFVHELTAHCTIHEQYIFYQYRCRLCNEKCLSWRALRSHMADHRQCKLTICGICGEEFPWSRRRILSKHIKKHSRDIAEIHRLISKETNPLFAAADNQSRGFSPGSSDSESHICAVCKSVFVEKKDYVSHMKLVHRTTYFCQFCDKSYDLIESLANHCQKHPGFLLNEFRCHLCNMTFASLRRLEDHLSLHNSCSVFICCLCGQIFDTSSDRDSHQKSHGEDSSKRPTNSSSGGVLATTKQSTRKSEPVSTTKQSIRKTEPMPTTKQSTRKTEPVSCSYCNKTFLSSYFKRQHLLAKHLPWRCDHCPDQYDNMRRLAFHIRTRHADESSLLNFYCDTCKQNFKSVQELESDLSMHDSKSVFLCRICAMIFDSNQERNLHVQTHKAYVS